MTPFNICVMCFVMTCEISSIIGRISIVISPDDEDDDDDDDEMGSVIMFDCAVFFIF
jgi:hypothetical protein